jgi:hypothetical protein
VAIPFDEPGPFSQAPPGLFERALHLRHGKNPERLRRAVFVVVVTWLPLILLAIADDVVRGSVRSRDLMMHLAVHARFLVAAPLFILAEVSWVSELRKIAQHFLTTGLIRAPERARFSDIIESTRRLGSSRVAEGVVWLASCLTVFGLWQVSKVHMLPAWHTDVRESMVSLSWAGYWHVFVSLPLLLALVFGWMWRIVLWTRFLFLVARLDLCLLPSHPDQAGGLRFVGYSARSLSVLGFAFGTLAAGAVGAHVMSGADALQVLLKPLIGIVVFMLGLAVLPLLVFASRLISAMRAGLFEYGALAGKVGQDFRRKWVAPGRLPEQPLEANDFSADTDLNQIVEKVYAIKPVPVHLPSLIALAGVTALPFLPVLAMRVPPEVLLNAVAKVLL